MKELRIQHTATNPNLHTVIREGQKWQRNPPTDEVVTEGIHTVKEIKEDETIIMESEDDGSMVRLEKPIEILNTQEWNYWGEKNDIL